MKENSKTIGDKSEAKVLSALLDRGATVLKPWGDNQRYDFVIEKDGTFFRIQCKTAREIDGILKFSCKSVTTKNGKSVNTNYKGQIDYFMIYAPSTKQVYFIHVNECGIDECSFRLIPTTLKTKHKPKMAVEYELDRFFDNPVV